MDLYINTGLSGFTMIDKISSIDEKRIDGHACLTDRPVFMGVEALAQLSGLHARFLTQFQKHCFLLVIHSLDVTDVSSPPDTARLGAYLETTTQRAFSYAVAASAQGENFIRGRFIIGTVDYDQQFKREHLEPHYRKVFACLTKDLPNDSH